MQGGGRVADLAEGGGLFRPWTLAKAAESTPNRGSVHFRTANCGIRIYGRYLHRALAAEM